MNTRRLPLSPVFSDAVNSVESLPVTVSVPSRPLERCVSGKRACPEGWQGRTQKGFSGPGGRQGSAHGRVSSSRRSGAADPQTWRPAGAWRADPALCWTPADGCHVAVGSSWLSSDGPCRSVFWCGPSSLPSPVTPSPQHSRLGGGQCSGLGHGSQGPGGDSPWSASLRKTCGSFRLSFKVALSR